MLIQPKPGNILDYDNIFSLKLEASLNSEINVQKWATFYISIRYLTLWCTVKFLLQMQEIATYYHWVFLSTESHNIDDMRGKLSPPEEWNQSPMEIKKVNIITSKFIPNSKSATITPKIPIIRNWKSKTEEKPLK